MFVNCQGEYYPSADGLSDASPHVLKMYTEAMQGHSIGVPLCEYMTKWFYTVFDYRGGESIFNVPQLAQDSGLNVSTRFINLIFDFKDALGTTEKRYVNIFHLCKKMLLFQPNLKFDILQ